ncbi:C1 family peptidase [Bacteroides sp. An322]|uniref:C1 family peptidase n=1 Tax=Bacteroides sp. An322 TaxID=1965632 RepID=UPI000B3999E6|nr:C1 family peptidase [Bacteroides sp. An322]OUO20232.1 aminopeptidase [Bacteroides sp. An322]
MKLNYFTLAALFFIPLSGTAQSENGYQFTTVVQQKATPVKDQAVSGTCWCFATTSFIESELLRQGKGEYDLSEMFIVRQKYLNQMADNLLRHGKGNVTQGSITASWITAFNQVGIVPEEAYTGINYDSPVHNHSELAGYVEAISAEAVKQKKNSKQYQELANSLFDIYMGKVPETFTYKGKEYTPKSFAESLGIDTDDYIPLTSFTHKPYYKPFEVEIPDNWEHSQMYNLPLDELISVMDGALKSGYTLCWDGDVSEKGFAYLNGVAINPDVKSDDLYKDSDRAHWGQLNDTERLAEVFRFEHPYPEVKVTPEIRQQGYESGKTTDDHLMHITGIATDQNGTKYYITKNSWAADSNDFGGYLNMSESYVRAKTIYILVHKDALPKTLKEKLGI